MQVLNLAILANIVGNAASGGWSHGVNFVYEGEPGPYINQTNNNNIDKGETHRLSARIYAAWWNWFLCVLKEFPSPSVSECISHVKNEKNHKDAPVILDRNPTVV